MSSLKGTTAAHNIQVEELWSRVIGSESLLASWLGTSLLLLGNALLFFHMVTVSESLEVSRPLAGSIATGFVSLSVIVLLVAISSYRIRSQQAVDNLPLRLQSFEDRVKGWNNIVSSLLCFLFIFVGCVIIYGSAGVFLSDGSRSSVA